MTKKRQILFSVIRGLLAILIALLVATLLIFLSADGDSFAEKLAATGGALKQLLVGPLFRMGRSGTKFDFKRLTDILASMIPIIFTGLSVCVMFSANQFNLGSEGGIMLGAFSTAMVAVYVPMAAAIHPIVGVLAGGLAVAVMMLLPALLKTKLGVSEMVCSLMLNYIVMYFIKYLMNTYLADKTKGQIQSYEFLETSKIAPLIDNGSKLSWGFVVAIACVVNIFGDLLLVAVFHLGAAGAALATVFAQAISVVLSLLVIARRKLPFTFRKEQLRFDRPLTAGILRLGVPIALQDVLVGVSFLVILAIVNSLGLLQSAGMGIAEKVCAFVMLLPSAFSQSVSAFVAQNTGAAKPDRAKKALRYSVVTSLCISVFVFYFNFFHGDLLAGIFANDRAVILEAADYLKAYAIDCLLTSFLFCFVGYFSGLGKTVFVMTQGILGAFGVRIPVSFAMSRLPNVRLFYIGLATPCSTVVQVLLCLGYYAHLARRERRA